MKVSGLSLLNSSGNGFDLLLNQVEVVGGGGILFPAYTGKAASHFWLSQLKERVLIGIQGVRGQGMLLNILLHNAREIPTTKNDPDQTVSSPEVEKPSCRC